MRPQPALLGGEATFRSKEVQGPDPGSLLRCDLKLYSYCPSKRKGSHSDGRGPGCHQQWVIRCRGGGVEVAATEWSRAKTSGPVWQMWPILPVPSLSVLIHKAFANRNYWGQTGKTGAWGEGLVPLPDYLGDGIHRSAQSQKPLRS